jgi:hypothetical protein
MFHSVRPYTAGMASLLLIESCFLLILSYQDGSARRPPPIITRRPARIAKVRLLSLPFDVSRQLTPQPDRQTRLPYPPILLRAPFAPSCPIATSQIVVAQAQVPLDVDSSYVPDSKSGKEMGMVRCEPGCD